MEKNNKEMYNCFVANESDLERKWFISPVKNNELDRVYECFIYEPNSGWLLGTAHCKLLPKYSKEAKHILNYHIGKLMIDTMKDLDKEIIKNVSVSHFYETIKCNLLDSIRYTDDKFNSLVVILDFKKDSAPVKWEFNDTTKGAYYKIAIV